MKHWIKRIICLVFAVTLCVGFVGCRANPASEGSSSDAYSDRTESAGSEYSGNSSDGGSGDSADPNSSGGSDSAGGSGNVSGTGGSGGSGNISGTGNSGGSGNSGNSGGTGSSGGSGVNNADVSLPVRNMGGRTFTFAAPSWDDTVNIGSDWVTALEKKYNCKFKNLNLNNDYTTLYASILSGSPIADVVVFNYSNFYPAVKDSLLLELKSSENINYADSSCFIPKLQEKATTINGKLYGVIDTYCFRNLLVYNRSIITGDDDLLTLYNNGQLTWDRLYEILQKAKASGKAGIAGEMHEQGVLQTFIHANGGTCYTRNGLTFTYSLESQNTRDALAYVQKLAASGLIMPMEGGNYLYPQTQFAKGRVAMMIVDGYNLDYIAKNAKFDYGVVMIPSKNNPKGGLVDLTEFECYSIPATVEKPDDVQLIFAAWKQGEEKANEGKQNSLDRKTNNLDKKDAAIIKKYAQSLEQGIGIIDYSNALVDYYGDDINDEEMHCLYSEISVQTFLERVGAIYKKKAADFNK